MLFRDSRDKKTSAVTGPIPSGKAPSVRGAERLLLLIGVGLLANAMVGAVQMRDVLLGVWGVNLFIWAMLLRSLLSQGKAWAWWVTLLLSAFLFVSGTINLGSAVLRLVSGLPLPWTPFAANLLYIIFLPLLITQLLKRETRAAVGIAKRL